MLAVYGVSLPVDAAKNPFLARVAFLKAARVAAEPVQITTPGNAQGAESLGLFSASDVASALGSLIAKRVKQDAELLALEALTRELEKINQDPRYDKPLDKLLPQSMRYLETINPSAASPSMWSVLQTDFRQDLQITPNNLPPFLDSLHSANTAPPLEQYFIDMGASLGAQIAVGGRTPYTIVDALANQSNAFYQRQLQAQTSVGATWPVLREFQQADAAAQALMIFSHTFSVDKKSEWQTADQVTDYLRTTVKAAGAQPADPLYLLLGLSYVRDAASYRVVAQALFPGQSADTAVTLLASSLAGYVGRGTDFASAIAPLLNQFAKLQTDVKSLPLQSSPQPPTLADVHALVTDLGGLASSVTKVINTVEPNTVSGSVQQSIDKWKNELETLAQIATSARAGDYQGAMAALIVELPELLPQECGGPANGSEKGQSCHIAGGGLVDFIAQKGPLIASLAQAKSSADFTAALDSYALPAGSFTQIQNETRSFTLNAYFGAEAGAEILSGNLGGSGARRVAPRLGFTAPVGIAYNWAKVSGDAKDTDWHFATGSQSVFVSALDVGAIASFRLGSGGGGQIPPVRWSNILAPGLFYVWTMKNTPFSIMVGTEYGPELRQVSTTSGNTLDRAAWQLPVIAFAFNIPLFQLSGRTTSTLDAPGN
ncbi:MAG: hypothetical protein ABSC32_22240 [Steroidobacteraceae bacterium]|jgi:hypothetical protein